MAILTHPDSMITQTHTYSTLAIPAAAYDAILAALREAGDGFEEHYTNIVEGALYLDQIALTRKEEPAPSQDFVAEVLYIVLSDTDILRLDDELWIEAEQRWELASINYPRLAGHIIGYLQRVVSPSFGKVKARRRAA